MYRLFIVEDDDGIADGISSQASMWGIETVCADDFQNVISQFTEVKPHIVLPDISLPFYNGYHWCSQIGILSSVPIIFISSASDSMNIIMAMNMGADDFITKPFDMSVLMAKVIALLCGVIFIFIFLLTFWLYGLPLGAVLYPTALCSAVGIVFLAFDFSAYKKDRQSLKEIKSVTDAMLSSLVQSPSLKHEGWAEVMKTVISAHDDFSRQTKEKYSDMVTYYTVWAHQIKTPIASMRLILGVEDNELSRKASAELFRIEQYVDMVLAFLRLGSF